jgi:hypothetical protein
VRVDTGDVSVHVVVGKEGPSDDALCSELRRVLDAAPSSERLGTGARQVSPRLLGLVEALIAWRVAQGEGTGVQVHGALVLQLSRTAITVAHLDGDEPQLSSWKRTLSLPRMTLRGDGGHQARIMSMRTGAMDQLTVEWSIPFGKRDGRKFSMRAEWKREAPPESVKAKPEPAKAKAEPAKPKKAEPWRTPRRRRDRRLPTLARGADGTEADRDRHRDGLARRRRRDRCPAVTGRGHRDSAGGDVHPGTRRERSDPASRRRSRSLRWCTHGTAGARGPRCRRTHAAAPTAQRQRPAPRHRPAAPPLRAAAKPERDAADDTRVAARPRSAGAGVRGEAADRAAAEARPAVQAAKASAGRHAPRTRAASAAPLATALDTWQRTLRAGTAQIATLAGRSNAGLFGVIGAFFVVMFVVGLIVGNVAGGPKTPGQRSPLESLAAAIGIGGARYECRVTSVPAGARITIDGKSAELATPTTLLLKPGHHSIALSVDGAGSRSYPVNGDARQRVTLEADLTGSLVVKAPGDGSSVSVWMDGSPMGPAPVALDHVEPGLHELAYGNPGGERTEEVIQVHIGRRAEAIARSLAGASADGEVEVRAKLIDDTGTVDLRTARVWVDGALRGVTPLVLRLPRGRHSFRAAYAGEQSEVDVIDLPGGNRRFADFTFGRDEQLPRIVVTEGLTAAADAQTVAVRLDGMQKDDVLEMWLHVRAPRGTWMRYPMALHDKATGVVGSVTIGTNAEFDVGYVPYYVSATSRTGDEYFTEIRTPDRLARRTPSRPAANHGAADRNTAGLE